MTVRNASIAALAFASAFAGQTQAQTQNTSASSNATDSGTVSRYTNYNANSSQPVSATPSHADSSQPVAATHFYSGGYSVGVLGIIGNTTTTGVINIKGDSTNIAVRADAFCMAHKQRFTLGVTNLSVSWGPVTAYVAKNGVDALKQARQQAVASVRSKSGLTGLFRQTKVECWKRDELQPVPAIVMPRGASGGATGSIYVPAGLR